MIIDISQISESGFPFDFKSQPDLDDETARLAEFVSIRGKLIKRAVQIDAEGKIEGSLEIECTRCLQKVKTPLDISFKAVFIGREFDRSGKESELHGDELDVSVFEGETLDLDDLAREQILLALPARFLCREDCKGLCGQCGANKNSDDCRCKDEKIDPRWSALKKFKA